MKPADTFPSAGPVFPAWVAPAGMRLRRSREQQQGPFWVLAAAMSLALIPCPLLVLIALVRRELTCIPWVMVGFVPGGVAVLLLLTWGAWQARLRSRPAVPDESVLVRLDRLREYTRARKLEVAADRHAEAWLTSDGCYLGVGEYHSWDEFTAFRLEKLQPVAFRIALRRRPPRHVRIWFPLLLAVLGGLMALGPVIDLITAGMVYAHNGWRWDVAAAVTAAAALLISFCALAVSYLREPGRPGSPTDELLLLADGELLNRADLVTLLRRHLPERA